MLEQNLHIRWCSGRIPSSLASLLSWSTQGIFSLFAARFLFATAIFQGVPGSEHFVSFWAVIGLSFCGGAVGGGRSGLVYLAILPALCALAETKLVPIWNLPTIVLAALFLGAFCRRLVLFRTDGMNPPSPLVFAVDSLSLAVLLGSIFALLHPSFSNSLSVAFSVPSWSEKNEFNAMTMGFNWAAGPIFFSLLARLWKNTETEALVRIPIRLVYFQAACVALFALPQIYNFIQSGTDVSRRALTIPFGAVHNLAGPLSLFVGFFLAMLISGIMVRRLFAGPLIMLGMLFPLVVYASSKSLWIGIALTIGGLMWWCRFRLALLGITLFAGVVLSFFTWSKLSPSTEAVAVDSISSQFQYLIAPSIWKKSPSFSERVLIWPSAANAALKFPLSGLGLGAFSHMISAFGPPGFTGTMRWNAYSDPSIENGDPTLLLTYNSYHAHNDFLELAAGCGIPTALLFCGLVAMLLFSAFEKRPGAPTSLGAAFPAGAALATFLIVACFDSRLLSLPDSLLFWQFALITASAPSLRDSYCRLKKVALFSLLAPLTVLFGSIWTLTASNLPNNLTFGVWNWHWTDADGSFLLAKESQFLIPPEESLKTLVFGIPKNSELKELNLRVLIDGVEAASGRITPESSLSIEVENFRHQGVWAVVRTEADRWVGRGALGSPFGVKPYAVSMTKVR